MPANLLIDALRHPDALPTLSLPDWEHLIRLARRADLLARIAGLVQQRGLLEEIPSAPRAHLLAALTLASAQHDEVRREVSYIAAALEPLDVQIVLLKGAAYVMNREPAALGRLFTDVDILVPRERLAEVEATLMLNGWATTHHSAYDQRYYREWMHELPPLEHIHRHTVLDVHHALLPETARLKPPVSKLLEAARSIDGIPRLQVLAPTDMVLHSMTHLLQNEELSRGLRDLSDLDLLLREFSGESGFWKRLDERAAEMDLRPPLYYGLRYVSSIFKTPTPSEVLAGSLRGAPPWPVGQVMDALFSRAVGAASQRSDDRRVSSFLLYLRAHWLRMPPALLLRHLLVKTTQRIWTSPERTPG
jgi:hypothetical protein